ncbi:unnamed protein product [Prorocentrum cordatum]|uniref:Poly [ADP-ribose] polymerase n=1 Tax=Prorocentrum cordatum TaxID=2364126 RepID=A0ABN9RLU3_9DINO|nr:unnamed protein product [Polarella glacialis]
MLARLARVSRPVCSSLVNCLFEVRVSGVCVRDRPLEGQWVPPCAVFFCRGRAGWHRGASPSPSVSVASRCLIGNPYVVHKAGDYISEAKAAGNDCVLGDRETVVNTYREYVFFDETQVYPEYVIIYKRQYDESRVPRTEMLRKSTTGTTGRNWQVRLDKGWSNIPVDDVNQKLLHAKTEGVTKVEVMIGDFKYTFDLEKKEQTNCSTGNVRALRPPMVSR